MNKLMKVHILLLALIIALPFISSASAQTTKPDEPTNLTPVDTVKEFYHLLHEKRYVEGFRLSVYRSAIEGLSAEELRELEPDFDQVFANIPDPIKVLGSQSTGKKATVFIKATDDPKDVTAEEVLLIQVNNQWLVGDEDTLKMVRELGRKFFFEIRIRVNEDNVNRYMGHYIGAQKLHADANKGNYGTVDDLIHAQFLSASLKNGEIYGYKFTIELAGDKRSFWIHAEPLNYSKTGRLSFYADLNGVYKFDNGGKVYRAPLGNNK
jgi:hypothetical protein